MDQVIVLYDGDCLFCNSSVQFILKRDTRAVFQFASLQGKTGESLRAEGQIPATMDSLCLLLNGKSYIKSAAVLLICKQLGGLYTFLYLFVIIPRPIRDAIYSLFAKYRHKVSGKIACRLLTQEEKTRFLD